MTTTTVQQITGAQFDDAVECLGLMRRNVNDAFDASEAADLAYQAGTFEAEDMIEARTAYAVACAKGEGARDMLVRLYGPETLVQIVAALSVR